MEHGKAGELPYCVVHDGTYVPLCSTLMVHMGKFPRKVYYKKA